MIAYDFSTVHLEESEGGRVIVKIFRTVLGIICRRGKVLELTECHRKNRRRRAKKRSKRKKKKLSR